MKVVALENKNVFITGGAGFIGSMLVSKLCDANKITIFDNFTRDTLSSTSLADHPNVSVIQGDILDLDALTKATAGAEVVVHAAAIAGIESTVKAPVETMRVNMMGTANVLEAAHHAGTVTRLVEFSTSEVFGSHAFKVEEGHRTVTGAVGEARWTYAASKLAGEHLSHAYFKQHGLPVVTVRPFNVYGPGQTGEGALSIFIRKALRDEDILIFGDGSQIRAWCFVDDMVNAVLIAMTHPNAPGESFNIGNSRAVATIYGLADTIRRVLNSKSRILFRDALSADIELRIPSVTKARELIGFEAQIDLEEGIERTAAWISENEAALQELSPIFTNSETD